MCDWTTPFDEAMLDKPVVILCRTENDAKSLFKILEKHGIRWGSGTAVNHNTTYFEDDEVYPGGTCYHVTPDGLKRGPIEIAENYAEWRDYIKCTFNIIRLDDFTITDTASLF